VKELRRVKASELVPSPHNWRQHPASQRNALSGVLEEIGYAGALLVRELDDGSYGIIDGHLRAETTPDMEVPVLVLDVDEREAKYLLATLDPLGAMAEANDEALAALMQDVESGNAAVQEMLAGLYEMPEVTPVPSDEFSAPNIYARLLIPARVWMTAKNELIERIQAVTAEYGVTCEWPD